MSVEKREKKFMKLTEYLDNPYFNAVKELYVNDKIKTLPTAINLLKKIKLTKKNIINKNSIKTVYKINDLLIKNKLTKNITKKMIRKLDPTIIKTDNLQDEINKITKKMNIKGHFSITLKSGISDIKHTFKFVHPNHFNNWFDRFVRDKAIATSTSFGDVYHIELGEYKTLFGDFVKIIDVKPIGGGCNKHKQGEKECKSSFYQLKLFNPVSRSNNCFFKAVEYIIEQPVDPKKMRKQFNLVTDTIVSVDDAYKILQFLEVDINIIEYDTNEELDAESKYIVLKDDHYYALMSFESVDTDKKVKRSMMTFDFETRQTDKFNTIKASGTKMYLLKDTICCVYYETLQTKNIKSITYKTNNDKSSARMFIDFLNKENENNRHYNIIAHNGGNFDFYFIISCMTELELMECQIQMRGITIIGINYRNNTFKDSYCFLTDSLSRLSNSFKVEQGKITKMELHGKTISSSQLCFYKPKLSFNEFLDLENNDSEFWNLYVKYCMYDCIALFQIWRKFMDCVNGLISKINPYILSKCPLMSCSTIGSHSKKIIVEINKFKGAVNCYKKSIEQFTGISYTLERNDKEMTEKQAWNIENKTVLGEQLKKVFFRYVKNVDDKKYKFLCKFKRGGISHCNKPGKHMTGITGVDIASQYPASLIYSYIPCGESYWVNKYDNTKYGFYQLKNLKFNSYLLKPVALGLEGVSLNWSTNTMDELYCDSYMIAYLIDNYGLESFDVVEGLVSDKHIKSDKLFGKYVNTFYDEKKLQDKYKSEKDERYNEALRSTIKLYLNSLTGKLVEDPTSHFKMKFNDDSEYKLGGCGVEKTFNEEKINDWVVPGIMVYSYSKRLLFEYIKCLPKNSDSVIHIETDGIYFSTNDLEYFTESLNKYVGDYPCKFGEDLGNLKIEKTTHKGQVAYFLGKKFYCITMSDEYNNKIRDDKDKNIYRVKGIPQKTITEDGGDDYLVDVNLYERVYKGETVNKKFFTLKKSLFNSEISISSFQMSRDVKPNCKYSLFE